MASAEGLSPRTSIEIVKNGRTLVNECTTAMDGGFFDHKEQVAAVFDTVEGPLLVDFSDYGSRYEQTSRHKGPMGTVILEGDALRSSGKGARVSESAQQGIRSIHTGENFSGSQILGPSNSVSIIFKKS